MKAKKKIVLLLIILFLVLLVNTITSTYAKYKTVTNSEFNTNIARWNIKVNNQDITNNEPLTNSLTPIFPGNEYIAENVIAPGATGYFELEIDATNVDVSFKYDVTIEESDYLKDFIITGYEVDGTLTSLSRDPSTETTQENTSIQNTISYTDTNRIKTIKVYLEWIEGSKETMNNEDDTNVTINYDKVSLPVSLTFTQITS